MTRMLIGRDYEGVPCIKITKGTLDPINTPDGNTGAFLYNSKWAYQIRLNAIERNGYFGGSVNWPAGASNADFQRRVWQQPSTPGSNHHYYRASYFQGLGYQLPLFDVLPRRLNGNGYYKSGRLWQTFYGHESRGERVTTVEPATGWAGPEFGWKINHRVEMEGQLITYGDLLGFSDYYTDTTSEMYRWQGHDLVIWNLPGDESGISDAQPGGLLSGQPSIRLSKDGLRVAKPGYNVDQAFGTQLAFDSNMRPIKVIAADDIAIPSGDSSYQLPFAVPADTVCDAQFYTGGTLYYPAMPRQTPLGADWQVSGDRIYFSNPGEACRARFIVMAFDRTPQSSGNNEVYRKFTANGEDVFQFVRPGAGNPPSFADIVIDSRWPSLRLLSQGYFGVGDGAQQTHIPIDTTGFYPIIKYMTVHGGYGGRANDGAYGYDKMVKPPLTAMFWLRAPNGGVGWTNAGDSTYAAVSADRVIFNTFRGAPMRATFASQTALNNGQITFTYPSSPVNGIRYYIFGIPKKD